jgi:hypothetical protein
MNLARSRVTRARELGILAMVFEAAPEHVERSGVIDGELEAMVVGLWWMCEDNQCKIFKTKEVKGMGREPGILTTHAVLVFLVTPCSAPYSIRPPV